MFCRPLGSPGAAALATTASAVKSAEGGDDVECSSDSEFNSEEAEESPTVAGVTDHPDEPAFNASCLDTRLERTFEGNSLILLCTCSCEGLLL